MPHKGVLRMNKEKYFLLGVMLLIMVFCAEPESERIKASGVVDGDVITVKSLVAGKTVAVNMTEGIRVVQGDILAEVDSEKLLTQIKGLQIKEKEIEVTWEKINSQRELFISNLEYWEDQVKRLQRLSQKESISEDEQKKAELKLKEVRASLFEVQKSLEALAIQRESLKNQKKQLELQIQDHIIQCPVTGVVVERFVSQREALFPGSPVADVLDLDSLFVETFLEGQEMSRLELGQEVILLLDGEPKQFTGCIINFGRQAEFSPKYIISEKERKSLLYRVKIRINDSLGKFKLGMPVTVVIPE
ncbi:MAG: HlyD family efflux transporter periplasmic adaptor subunit [Candidatus Aminicenantes bacterium]|nr:HlyD family efflux transporter periplasmic adaptor subunit [Candidatus Aminicenantes bacterium]